MNQMKKRTVERIYGLTPMQEGMLFHKMLDERSGQYVVQETMSIGRALDAGLVKSALDILSQRHEILRTAIVYRKVKVPQQVLFYRRQMELEQVDLTPFAPQEALDRLEALKRADVERGFDLERETLLRMKLVKTGPASQNMIWSFHHIIMDGWCLSILYEDFMSAYLALEAGEPPETLLRQAERGRSESASYEDYVKWVRRQNHDESLRYWKTMLHDYAGQSGIEAQGTAEASSGSNAAHTIRLDDALSERIVRLAAGRGVTTNTFFEAVWGMLLHKYNRGQDAVFGKVVSGRGADLRGIEKLVGLFINTIPVRIRSNPGETFEQLLERTHDQALRSGKHDYGSLGEVQAGSALPPDAIRTLMVFENYYTGTGTSEMERLIGAESEKFREQTNYPITLMIAQPDVFSLTVLFDASRYAPEEVERLLRRFESLAEQASANPGERPESFDLALPSERERIVHTFNDTRRPYARDSSLQTLFAAQALRTPHAQAVLSRRDALTYAELDAGSDALLHSLRRAGVQAGGRVGILTDKSGLYVAGLLAILKAGCAYVPLTSGDPAERLSALLGDADVSALLHLPGQGDTARAIAGGRPLVELDLSAAADYPPHADSAANAESAPHHPGSGEDEAYVLFTSGTTGRPKGVRVRHRSVTRLVQGTGLLDFAQARVLQTGALAFDASTFEIWGPLLSGGFVYLSEPAEVPDAAHLAEQLRKHDINTMWMTAQLFNHYMDDDPAAVSTLDDLLIGGERLSQRHVSKLLEQPQRPRLINGYGPTENTTFSLMHVIEDVNGPLPIGRPIANSTAYILDPGGRLCGIGQPGELVVGGDGVAIGYLNRPEQTAEVFGEDPYAAGGTWYRTGDLARWRPDGTVDYLGRTDTQVKIRGYRVEPGEIEHELRSVSGVRDAAVTVREDEYGAAYLCGYAAADDSVDVEEIRRELGRRLPGYLVPASITRLERLPMTSNGKLDRAALPEPAAPQAAQYAAPQNEREAAVIEVFEDILGVRGLGRDASFFELGGHSLRATRAINRLEARTGVRLPLTAIFEAPTPAALALRLQEAEHRVYVPIPAAPVQPAYPMSSAQKRLYLIQQLEGAGTAYNLPGLLELEGDLDLLRIRSAFAQLMERHESLRTSFHLEDGELIQRIEPQVEAVVEFEEGEADEDREVWLSRFVRPFELDTAPLIRLKVIRTGGERGALLFDLHHLIADGASMNVITREFSRLYAGESLPRPERQYKDYSEWMRLRDQGAAEEYWLKQFEEATPVLDLPLDYPRGQMQSFAGASFHAVAPAELSERVRRLCRDTGTTEYMVFLSAYFILLSRYSRQADLVVGTPVAGRTHRDTENMVGMFVNTLAMRARPESDKRIVDFLREIKDLCLTGFDYQEFPFETLIDRASFNRDLSRNPLFDVMFVHQNNEQEELAARHVSFGDVEGDAGSAKFDMTLTVDGDGRDHRIHWEYCTDLLGEATVRRYAEHFLRILEAMTLRSSQRIGQIDSLNAVESELIRETFSQGAVRAAPEDTFVDRWAEQAAAFPDRTAVVCGADRHTYGELEQKANRIANALISWGISPGDVVAFALPRGLPLVAAVLGILKSGAAFLPIEPDYPEDRIRFMVEDSRAKVIMTEQSAYALVFRHCKQVPVDVLLSGGESEAPAVRPLPSDLGYCIYTSGSTGTPKGAQLSHGNLMNYVLHARESYVKSAPVMPLFTSICFDLTLTSLFLPLLAGGRIHVYRDGIEHDLFAVFRDTELTIIKLTPSHLKLAAGSPEAMPLPGLECLIVGGEELESRTAREALRTFGAQIEIHNEYGPTETTVGCCDYVFDPRSERRAVLIGRPIANTQTWIIGEGGSLCGIGMPGELCIGGSGVGRGYLNLPERSAETFVPDPYSPGQLLYRTGDLAQWLPDGQIEYLGRIDEQVKIRGFRIELGEIEEVIKSAPGVADAALAIKRDPAGEPVLCAYVVGERPCEASHLAVIADRLRATLPDYMIPERMMAIGALDVSANGKLDRKKLPDPVWAQTEPYTAPATELETELTLLFEQTLGVPRIGRTDHFFERGGNSIKAIKLIAGLRRLGHSLSIVHLFKHPTPAALAVFLDEQAEFGRQSASADEANPAANEAEPSAADAKHPANSAPAGAETAQAALALMESRARNLAAAPAEAVRPLSPVQRLSYRMGVRSSYAERALNRDVNPETFEVVMQGMFRRHPLLRSTFVIGGETWERRELACPARIDVPLLDWSAKPEAEQEAAIAAIRASYTEFDDELRYDGKSLAHRMILIKRSRNDYLFLMTCTHLIFDGMSSQAFCDQLSDEYDRHPVSGEHDAEVYDYQHYVDQILRGPVGVTEAEIVERLDLNRFRDSVVRYRERLALAPLHAFRTVCEVEGAQSQGRIEALPELPGELYRAVLLFLFPDASIPIFNVHTGRTYTDRRYHDYLGEFIDFVPCVVDPSAVADYGADIADKLEFMSRHNINMSALLVDEQLRGRYPGLSALLADIRPEQLDIPVYNDLSIFDARDTDAEPFLREEAERSAARADDTERFDPFATGIVWNGDRFYVQTVCTEGREDELAAHLRSYIHKRLSELPVL